MINKLNEHKESFNSRSRVGSDLRANLGALCKREFQFTLPRGERLHPEAQTDDPAWFQFTLPRGERLSP